MGQTNHGREADVLSFDACLELLANRQRRVILGYFLDSGKDEVSVDDVVTELIADEAHRTGERPGHDTVATTLFHVHLPRFADAGVLDYDTRNLQVRYHGDRRIEELYEVIREIE